MNAAEHRSEKTEREETARLLPVPAERELPTDRQLLHRELLMSQIRQPASGAAASTAPVTPPRRRRRLRYALIAAPLIGAVVIGGTALHRNTITMPGTSDEWSPAGTVSVQPGTTLGVAATLDRIASAAEARPALAATADQYVYVRTEARISKVPMGGEGWQTDSLTVRESWYSQRPATQDSLYRQLGVDTQLHGQANPVGLFNPTYAWAASLPTDPRALLASVYADLRDSGVAAAQGMPQAAFEQIGQLLDSTTLPPRTAAALYRAVALIPGVVLVPDSVDAAGRHGLGIARTESSGLRQEWVFDSRTLAYLGDRQYLVRDTTGTEGGPKGLLEGTSAVLAWGVTDHAGTAPASPRPVG